VYVKPLAQPTSTSPGEAPKLFLLQHPSHRPANKPYNDNCHQKPTSLRLKPNTGILELDIPIDTTANYNRPAGSTYAAAIHSSPTISSGASHGLASGFSTTSSAARRLVPPGLSSIPARHHESSSDSDVDMSPDTDQPRRLLSTQTLGGKLPPPQAGDPIYMLGTLSPRTPAIHLTPVSGIIQLRPQLHHLDALDELERAKPSAPADPDGGTTSAKRPGPAAAAAAGAVESKALDLKFASADDKADASRMSNASLLRQIRDDKFVRFDWVDESEGAALEKRETELQLPLPLPRRLSPLAAARDSDQPPRLESMLSDQEWLDRMSAPREGWGRRGGLMGKVRGRERERLRRKRNDLARRRRGAKAAPPVPSGARATAEGADAEGDHTAAEETVVESTDASASEPDDDDDEAAAAAAAGPMVFELTAETRPPDGTGEEIIGHDAEPLPPPSPTTRRPRGRPRKGVGGSGNAGPPR